MSEPRRNRMVIDFEVQYSLLRKISIHWCLFLVANAIALLFWTRLLDDPTGSWSDTWSHFARSYLPMLIISICMLPVFLLDTAKLSNRFSGPVLRVRKALQSISNGEKVDAVVFRKDDFWKCLADDFNEALKLSKKQAKVEVPSSNATKYPEA